MSNEDSDIMQLLEKADTTDDTTVIKESLNEVIQKLSALGVNQTVEQKYLLGYAWYNYPDDSDLRAENIQKYLKEVLRLEPNHLFARLYLAHYYFDIGNYIHTEKLLSSIDEDAFSEIGQAWRDAKNAELLLCCHLKTHNKDAIENSVTRLCERLTYLEPCMNPRPDELCKVLIDMN